MASGKSSVVGHLQSATRRPTASVDTLVTERAGMPISRIFETSGEQHFRELEMEALSGLAADRHLVVDTGGGIVETPQAVSLLRRRGVIIWLDSPWEATRARLLAGDTHTRPLIESLGWVGLEELYHKRRRLYANAADFRISASTRSVADISRVAMLRSLIWERRQEGKR